MSKAFTHHIERHNLNLRIHIKLSDWHVYRETT
ncbi:hypothetical protein GCX98_08025 [Salmonella enterica subsp. diarizonae]|uniref:Uncharacterized protein n=1 Tax=Salmonella diarizonae TaxID=59204 RepID=A0A5Y1Y6Z3_SALDZ|nr:hypothetical protein [Salmonella enterica]ECC3914748.1 hypothetical protein [Salmonella enterica subsp. diarizonae]EDT4351651.1 hypothetical protein [Salmonella enterica subsp. diarizonae serovar 50:k:z]EAM8779895.1 hypothetical protein [Salmonella enterica]EAN5691331.1 hypothetical protein [Salmonella enterica]